MSNSANTTHKLFTGRVHTPASTFVGESGRMFYHEDTGELRLSDGITPGGLPIFTGGGSFSGNLTLVGDITAFGNINANITTTLSTVNSNVGIFGSSLTVPQITVNSKGLITAVSSIAISPPSLSLYAELPVSAITPVTQGNNSIALGSGATTNIDAANSLAIGYHSLARIPGGVVQANGRFSSTGDAQVGRYLVRYFSGDSSWHEALIDGNGGSQRITLLDYSTWTFTATITGHRIDNTGGHAGYIINGVIYREAGAGTTAIQGSIVKNKLAESVPLWDVDISADTTNGALQILVKGQSGHQVRWLALVETVEITN